MNNFVKTRVVLNQTEGTFPDFNRREFPKTAIAIYEAARDSIEYQDKVVQMSVLSFPLNEAIQTAIRSKLRQPFKFYDEILSAKIVQGTMRLIPFSEDIQ